MDIVECIVEARCRWFLRGEDILSFSYTIVRHVENDRRNNHNCTDCKCVIWYHNCHTNETRLNLLRKKVVERIEESMTPYLSVRQFTRITHTIDFMSLFHSQSTYYYQKYKKTEERFIGVNKEDIIRGRVQTILHHPTHC